MFGPIGLPMTRKCFASLNGIRLNSCSSVPGKVVMLIRGAVVFSVESQGGCHEFHIVCEPGRDS